MTTTLLKTGLRHISSARWLMFYSMVLVAWFALYALHVERVDTAGPFGAEFWRSLCVTNISFSSLLAMWALMAAAMMVPGFVPMLKTYDDLKFAGAGTTSGFWSLFAGYISVWLCFSVVAALVQYRLFDAKLVDIYGASRQNWLSAGLLIVAGAYQFSPLKQACLRACQTPLMSFMARWRPGSVAAFEMGLREGFNCLGCCWALMCLGFVGGTMNLAFMALGMVLMSLEKLPEIGNYLSRPLGWLLLAAGGLLVFV